jgi:hypothetical protein
LLWITTRKNLLIIIIQTITKTEAAIVATNYILANIK